MTTLGKQEKPGALCRNERCGALSALRTVSIVGGGASAVSSGVSPSIGAPSSSIAAPQRHPRFQPVLGAPPSAFLPRGLHAFLPGAPLAPPY